MRWVAWGVVVATSVLALVISVAAQAQDLPQRKELRRADLSGAPGIEVITSLTELRPGDELPRHSHHGIETGIVVQGTMVQPTSQAPMMLAAGSPIFNLRDVPHGGYKVVGPGILSFRRPTSLTRESRFTNCRSKEQSPRTAFRADHRLHSWLAMQNQFYLPLNSASCVWCPD